MRTKPWPGAAASPGCFHCCGQSLYDGRNLFKMVDVMLKDTWCHPASRSKLRIDVICTVFAASYQPLFPDVPYRKRTVDEYGNGSYVNNHLQDQLHDHLILGSILSPLNWPSQSIKAWARPQEFSLLCGHWIMELMHSSTFQKKWESQQGVERCR